MRWSSSPACPARASRRWRSARSTPRRSGATSNRSRPTPGGCSTRWPCRRSTRSTACRRRSPCSSSAARRPRARRSAASRRSRTCCGCSIRAPATIRRGQPLLYAESFSPNTPEGACPECHGLGRVYEVTERSMVPDDSLTIRERAIAAWPPAWHGQNLRDILRHARLRRRSSRGASCRRRTATGSCSPTSSRSCRSTPGFDAGRSAARAQAQGRAELSWARSPARGATCCTPSPPPRAR